MKTKLTIAFLVLSGCATLAEKNAELDEQGARIPVLGRVPEGNCHELGNVTGDAADPELARKLMLREAARKNANYVRADRNKPGHESGMAYRCVRFLFDNPFKGDGM